MTFFDEVVRDIKARNGGALPQRQSGGWYDDKADCLFYYLKDVPHYAERVDGLLTVYLDLTNDDVVGVQIKAIKTLLDQNPVIREAYIRQKKIGIDLLLIQLVRMPSEEIDSFSRRSVYESILPKFLTKEIETREEILT